MVKQKLMEWVALCTYLILDSPHVKGIIGRGGTAYYICTYTTHIDMYMYIHTYEIIVFDRFSMGQIGSIMVN